MIRQTQQSITINKETFYFLTNNGWALLPVLGSMIYKIKFKHANVARPRIYQFEADLNKLLKYLRDLSYL